MCHLRTCYAPLNLDYSHIRFWKLPEAFDYQNSVEPMLFTSLHIFGIWRERVHIVSDIRLPACSALGHCLSARTPILSIPSTQTPDANGDSQSSRPTAPPTSSSSRGRANTSPEDRLKPINRHDTQIYKTTILESPGAVHFQGPRNPAFTFCW